MQTFRLVSVRGVSLRTALRWSSSSSSAAVDAEFERAQQRIEKQIDSKVQSLVQPMDHWKILGRSLLNKSPHPMVLLCGNHSSGKSTFINDFLGKKVQDTGVAPTDDGFTLIMRSEVDSDEDGPTLVGTPSHGFQDLATFGPTFVSHLKLKLRELEDTKCPKNLMLVDSPGMIGSPANDSIVNDRGYDLRKAMRWFAERADLILIFFDPANPGTTGETLDVLTESLSDLGHKSLIVMNKVDQFDNAADFARAYGALCWNVSKVVPRKDIPRIYTTYTPTGDQTTARAEENGLPVLEFEKTREEIHKQVLRAPKRKVDNLLTLLDQTAWRLRMQTLVSEALRVEYTSMVRSVNGGIFSFTAIGVGIATSVFLATQNIPVLVMGSLLSLAVGAGLVQYTRPILSNYQKNLIENLESKAEVDLKSESDRVKFQSFKPLLVEKLSGIDLSTLPKPRKGFLGGSDQAALDKLINDDIPKMRDEAHKARYFAKSA